MIPAYNEVYLTIFFLPVLKKNHTGYLFTQNAYASFKNYTFHVQTASISNYKFLGIGEAPSTWNLILSAYTQAPTHQQTKEVFS